MRPVILFTHEEWRDAVSMIAVELQTMCKKAGKILEDYREKGDISVFRKEDGTPVTEADIEVSEFLESQLKNVGDKIPVLSEEGWSSDNDELAERQNYWIVDPLDGTRDFVNGKPDYTINIAWIKNKDIHMGCIYHPPTEMFYFAQRNSGAFSQIGNGELTPISSKLWPETSPRVLISRSHAGDEAALAKACWPQAEVLDMSSALKFCKIAEGYADLYFREGATMEWDTAAGQLLVEEAGGIVVTWQCEKLTYQKPERKNPGFIAVGNRGHISDVYDVLMKNKLKS